jgi:NAD(P)-dependent dehydrogenase (short-subunit alcohol dehydrogenase family)
MAKLVHSVAIRQDYYDTIPLNRYGTPEEIAAAVYFLCSPEASYVNGQTLAADGGFEALGVGLPTLRRQFSPDPKRRTPK